MRWLQNVKHKSIATNYRTTSTKAKYLNIGSFQGIKIKLESIQRTISDRREGQIKVVATSSSVAAGVEVYNTEIHVQQLWIINNTIYYHLYYLLKISIDLSRRIATFFTNLLLLRSYKNHRIITKGLNSLATAQRAVLHSNYISYHSSEY